MMNENYAMQPQKGGAIDVYAESTVVENIDRKIAAMKAEIARLEASKETLRPLLHMRIRDIREAMNY
jgi:uncharacterized small protein (DUF1192 family)